MSNEVLDIRCSIVRGGTSKAIFLMNNELPADPKARESVILAVFGSPSLRQLDGLGGADITTSKVAIIGPPTRPDADIDYTFGQVSMDEHFVDFGGNCGNISSGVAPFAIHHGLVNAVEPITTVRIHMTNTDNILIAKVYVKDGKPCVDGDCVIGGVPGTGSPIEMDWSDVTGSATGKLLPTGNAKDEIEMDGKTYTVSIVDAGNICVYVRAEDFGLTGYETPAQINEDKGLSAKLEHLRALACQKIGLVDTWQEARIKTPYQPFLVLLAPPADYDTYTGQHVAAEDTDIVVRCSVMLSIVKAFPGTGTACTGNAARVKGSLVYEMLSEASRRKEKLSIGHPTGTIEVTSIVEDGEDDAVIPKMKKVAFIRTARVLMDGTTYVRKSVL
jgi:2-methylaconitate cis-trans-isomerase PrpF